MTVTELDPNLDVEVRSYGGWRRTAASACSASAEGTVAVLGHRPPAIVATTISARAPPLRRAAGRRGRGPDLCRKTARPSAPSPCAGSLVVGHPGRLPPTTGPDGDEAAGAWGLPGPLAATKLLSAEDGIRRPVRAGVESAQPAI